jgi:hypothetical protein
MINCVNKYGFLMLLLPPIRRRIPASHSRASLCSIGAGFMELVISRGTFNPENRELRVLKQSVTVISLNEIALN